MLSPRLVVQLCWNHMNRSNLKQYSTHSGDPKIVPTISLVPFPAELRTFEVGTFLRKYHFGDQNWLSKTAVRQRSRNYFFDQISKNRSGYFCLCFKETFQGGRKFKKCPSAKACRFSIWGRNRIFFLIMHAASFSRKIGDKAQKLRFSWQILKIQKFPIF